MTKVQETTSQQCPTCFNGRCPVVNTTPDCPQPDIERIQAAQRAIPDVLIEDFKVKDRYETNASRLMEALRTPEHGAHGLAAAMWAIHLLIQNGMLSVHEGDSPIAGFASTERPKRRFVNRKFEWERPMRLPRQPRDYGREPACFDTFNVRGEVSLWEWWRSGVNLQSENKRDYHVAELCKQLGITSNTLNKYAKMAGVKTPGQGKKNHRYSAADRVRILDTISREATGKWPERARALLAENARKPTGDVKLQMQQS